MDEPAFTDKERRPTEATIAAALGRAAGAWRQLFDAIRAEHPDVAASWRYYVDAKGWLLKAARGSQTIFWASVSKGSFRVAFYFPERRRDELLASDLSDERKAEIRSTPPSGKLRRVALTFGPQRGRRDVLTLIALKRAHK